MTGRIPREVLWLLIATAITFVPFAWAGFFWDDRMVFREGGAVESLATLLEIPFRRCMLFPSHVEYDYYRPVIDSLFVLEYAVAGRTPFLYHLTNYTLHLANVLLAFGLLRRVLTGTHAGIAAAAGLAVFALHPIQSESVMWIAARPGVISLSFGLLMIHGLVRMVEANIPARAWLWGAAACSAYFLSLMSKEVAVALVPGLVPLVLLVPRERRVRAIAAICSLAAVTAAYLTINRAPGGNLGATIETLGLGGYAAAVFRFCAFYTGTLAWPFDMIPNYPLWIDKKSGMLPLGVVSMLAVLGVAGWAFSTRSPRGIVAGTALVYMGGSLVLPTLGGQFQVADRYAYQSMLGLGIAVAAGISVALERWPRADGRVGRVAALAALLMAAISLLQSLLWASERVMWTHAIRVDPKNMDARFDLSDYAIEAGNTELAVEHLQVGLSAGRPYSENYLAYRALLLGQLLGKLGRGQEAFAPLEIAKNNAMFFGQATVLEAIIQNDAGNRAESTRLLDSLPREGQPWNVYLSAASIARAQGDMEKAREWYRLARASGAPEDRSYE